MFLKAAVLSFLRYMMNSPRQNSVHFSEFTELCDANHDLVLEHFHRLRRAIGAGSYSSGPALCL